MEKKIALLLFACCFTAMRMLAQFNDPVGDVYYYVEELPEGIMSEKDMLAFNFNKNSGCLLNAYYDDDGVVCFYNDQEWKSIGGDDAKFRLSLIDQQGFTMSFMPNSSTNQTFVYQDKYFIRPKKSVSERSRTETTITYEFSSDRLNLKIKISENSRSVFGKITVKYYILSKADFHSSR